MDQSNLYSRRDSRLKNIDISSRCTYTNHQVLASALWVYINNAFKTSLHELPWVMKNALEACRVIMSVC